MTTTPAAAAPRQPPDHRKWLFAALVMTELALIAAGALALHRRNARAAWLRQHYDIEQSAHALAIHTRAVRGCRFDWATPKADLDLLVDAFQSVDPEAAARGAISAGIILDQFALSPGSLDCSSITDVIEAAAKVFVADAGRLRQAGF